MFDLGLLHLLDTLIDDIMTRQPVDFVRKEVQENRLSSNDLNTSEAILSSWPKSEKKNLDY